MKTVEFIIPLPKSMRKGLAKLYGLNAIYAGKHWSKRKADAGYWHDLLYSELRSQGIPRRIFQKPVHIDFWVNTGMDIDNHGYIVKLVIDSLKGYLIENDSRRFVKSYYVGFYSGDGIMVKISEVSA